MNKSAAGCLAFFGCFLQAQSSLSLSDAIREAQASHPQVRVAQDRIRSAEGLRRQAALTFNPRLFLQSENTRLGGTPSFSYPRDTDNFLYASQVFETAGKRDRRVELASSVVRLNEIESAALHRQIAGRVSLAYWSAAAAANLRDLIGRDVQAYEGIVQYHRDRVREGAVAELDLLRVELERDRLSVSLRTAEADYVQALIALQREMGRSTFSSPVLTDSIAAVSDLAEPDFQAVLEARPERRAARENTVRAEANLRLQRAMARTDPEVLLGYKRTAGYDTLIGGFQINLPVRNRNQGAIESAAAEVRLAENQTRAADSQIRAEVESAWAAFLARKRLLTETLEPMQTRATEIARIALAAYQEGGLDLLRLIDAQRARLDANTLYYRALSELQQSVINVRIATGAPL